MNLLYFSFSDDDDLLKLKPVKNRKTAYFSVKCENKIIKIG